MGGRDTSLGGPGGAFPSTLWSALEEAREASDEEARARLGALVAAYWKPAYHCIRAGWGKSSEDAKDLTQSFFTWLLSGKVLSKVERGRGRFRGFLKAALRNFLSNAHRGERAAKRGGDETFVRLDLADPRLEAAVPAASGRTPEQVFDREWARSLLEGALAEFERDADPETLAIFRRQAELGEADASRVYETIASERGLGRDAVKHQLARARARLREILVSRIREYALDDVEVQQELDLLKDAWR